MSAAFTPIDLSKLPAPSAIAELSFDEILLEMTNRFKADHPVLSESLNFESEPISALNQAWAYREVLFREYVNTALKASLLAFSFGTNLDNLAALIPLTRLEGESDTDFRARIQLAPEGFSTAGPKGAYIFHAKSASPDIVDVYVAPVTEETKGEVHLHILAKDGADINAVLTAVQLALSDSVRPLTDYPFVNAATRLDFNVEAVLEIGTGPDPVEIIAASRAAVESYIASRLAFGRKVTRAGLLGALVIEGVEDVDLISPQADIIPDEAEAVRLVNLTVTALEEGV